MTFQEKCLMLHSNNLPNFIAFTSPGFEQNVYYSCLLTRLWHRFHNLGGGGGGGEGGVGRTNGFGPECLPMTSSVSA